MRILTCIPFHYYESLAVPFSYYYTAQVLRAMGHEVHIFEFVEQAAHNQEGMNGFFLSAIRKIGYDLVFVETSKDEFFPETLDEARRNTVTLAWNSDDDWRWEDYSSKWARHYTFMVTTYRHIYEANKKEYPNLVLSQWACTGLFDGMTTTKDVPLSFVGGIYSERVRLFQAVASRLPLQIFSRTSLPPRTFIGKSLRKVARTLYGAPLTEATRILNYTDVNQIWNHSKVSLTPLQASRSGQLQVKGRVFEMGCSGTVMLCDQNPALYEFYAPGKEYFEYASVEECCDKATYLLRHDADRLRIASAYYGRTHAEHLWSHRYKALFAKIGLPC
jgi:spore maturation protein CgeB